MKSSLLNLVDLAGSERQKDTQTDGQRLKVRSFIFHDEINSVKEQARAWCFRPKRSSSCSGMDKWGNSIVTESYEDFTGMSFHRRAVP